jgi:pyruvate carboxylase
LRPARCDYHVASIHRSAEIVDGASSGFERGDGSVWKIEAAIGTEVGADDTILIIESMKMEIRSAVREPAEWSN